MINDFCDHLAATVTGYTVGSNIIVGALNVGKKGEGNPFLLVREAGPAPRETDGTEIIAKSIQLLSHAYTYQSARSICQLFADSLLNVASIELSSYVILSITGDDPSYLGVDENGYHQFVSNLVVRIKKKGGE